jgi:Zn-finger nucleic acid-binding protein
MNVSESRHCAACGQDLTAPAPLAATSAWTCPDCKQTLEAIPLENGLLFDCPGCGGQFADHQLLRALLERRDTLSGAIPRLSRPHDPLKQRVVYRPCPGCEALMNRRNFGGTSGIIVDICARHGTWFERGELPGVLSYVEDGGLERAQQLEAEARRRRALPPASFPLTGNSDDYPRLNIGETARELLELIVDLIRGRH